MRARLHDLTLARDGGYLLTIATRENVGALFDELHETDVDVTVKKHREKRSLDANAYAWVLMDKLALLARMLELKKENLLDSEEYGQLAQQSKSLQDIIDKWRPIYLERMEMVKGIQKRKRTKK